MTDNDKAKAGDATVSSFMQVGAQEKPHNSDTSPVTV